MWKYSPDTNKTIKLVEGIKGPASKCYIDIAYDYKTKNILVLDTNKNAVIYYTTSGQYYGEINLNITSVNLGSIVYKATAIAVDRKGRIFVGYSNGIIRVFNTEGILFSDIYGRLFFKNIYLSIKNMTVLEFSNNIAVIYEGDCLNNIDFFKIIE
jgi:hypothetical protein